MVLRALLSLSFAPAARTKGTIFSGFLNPKGWDAAEDMDCGDYACAKKRTNHDRPITHPLSARNVQLQSVRYRHAIDENTLRKCCLRSSACFPGCTTGKKGPAKRPEASNVRLAAT